MVLYGFWVVISMVFIISPYEQRTIKTNKLKNSMNNNPHSTKDHEPINETMNCLTKTIESKWSDKTVYKRISDTPQNIAKQLYKTLEKHIQRLV